MALPEGASGATPSVVIAVRSLKTPIGTVHVAASPHRVVSVELPRPRGDRGLERWVRERFAPSPELPALSAAVTQLREYFAHTRRIFDLALDPAGTEFQRRVWERVQAIPYGETSTYGHIADAIGNAHLARTVGVAVRANPMPIIIPCHRVIGADGSLAGYSGGVRRKIWLLRHEGVLLA